MRNKEYLAAVRARDGLLLLSTMHYADEVAERVSTLGSAPIGTPAGISGNARVRTVAPPTSTSRRPGASPRSAARTRAAASEGMFRKNCQSSSWGRDVRPRGRS